MKLLVPYCRLPTYLYLSIIAEMLSSQCLFSYQQNVFSWQWSSLFHFISKWNSFIFLPMFLVVYVLFMMCLQVWISSQSEPLSVFLGYSRLQKGYRHYFPEIKRYYMCNSVTFFFFFWQTPFFPLYIQRFLSNKS